MSELKALEMFKKDLETILVKTIGKQEKALERLILRREIILKEYKTENDIVEAYGCNIINSKTKDLYLDVLNGIDNVAKGSTTLTIYEKMLKNTMKDIEIEISLLKKE